METSNNLFLSGSLVEALGWTLLHSLWQGLIITLLLVLSFRQWRRPQFRYGLAAGALFLLVTLVAATFGWYYQPVSAAPGDWVFSAEARSLFAAGGRVSADPLQAIFPWLVRGWLLGVLVMGVRLAAELIHIHYLARFRTQPVRGYWAERLPDLCRQLGATGKVRLLETLKVSGPVVVGFIKPVILLPVGLLSGLEPRQVECILAHELAHVRRYDFTVNFLQSVVEVVLFFNPAVWWISARLREEREHCCDDLAVHLTGDRLTLVRTLAQLEEWRLGRSLQLAFSGQPAGLLGRVRRLLRQEYPRPAVSRHLLAGLILPALILLGSFSGEQPQNLSPAPEEQFMSVPMALASPVSATTVEWVKEKTANHLKRYQMPREHLFSTALDTLPPKTNKDEWEARRKEITDQIRQLEREMQESEEMKEIRQVQEEVAREMAEVEKEMRARDGEMQRLMAEQEAVMRKVEERQRELLNRPEFKDFEQKQRELAEKMAAAELRLREEFRDQNWEELHMRMDSLHRVMEPQFEKLAAEMEKAHEKMAAEMEALMNKGDLQRLETLGEEYHKRMEEMMQGKMEKIHERMESLHEKLNAQYEQRFEALHRKMEQLEQERFRKQQED